MVFRTQTLAAIAAIIFTGSINTATAALPNIFKAPKVRASAGVPVNTTAPSILTSTPEQFASAALRGDIKVSLGPANLAIPASKTYAAADIAATAAGAIMNKTAFGLAATLALPYVIDAVTGTVQETITPEPVAPNYAYTNLACTASTGTQYVASGGYSGHYYMSVAACQSQGRQAGFQYSCGDYKCKNLTTNQWVAGPWTGTTSCISGYSVDGTQCKSTQPISCTAPSYYDQATQMCIGSAFNEPANAQKLAQDIEETFNSNPTFPKIALDAVIEQDQEPANGVQKVEDFAPKEVQAGSQTTTKQYNDPATGHPTTAQTTKTTKMQVEKTGDNQIDVKSQVTEVTNITDNVTNITTTTTNTTVNQPGDTDEPTDPQDYTFSAMQQEYDDSIDTPEKTPITPVINDMKDEITTWASGVGLSAQSGDCSITNTWGMHSATSAVTVSFCEWSSEIGAIGLIILSFATLYGAFIIMGVKE